MTPEFSRPERIDTIGDGPRTVAIEASEPERQRLAARFGLVAVDALAATLTVRREAGAILVAGRLSARVVQACSVTGDPLVQAVDEPVALRFVEGTAATGDVELGEEALDTIEVEGGAIDLGEAAAETLALALDPFPRGPGAAAALRAAGVIGDDEVRPLTALAGLKALLAKD